MKIVLLGASHWHNSCYYAPAKKLGHEVVLIDEQEEVIREKGEAHGFKWYTDYGVLDQLKPDFAFVLGRHDQTAGLIAMCVERRIPFLAEKPGAPDAETLARLARRCDEIGLFNASPFSMRWDTEVMRVKKMLDAGQLGRVAYIHAAYLGGAAKRYADWGHPWVLEKAKSFGGSMYVEAVHAIDVVRFWGFEPQYRAGRASYALNRGEVDDMITFLVDYGPDTYGILESGYLVQNPYGGLSFSLYCEKANIDYRHLEMTVTWADGRKETTKSPSADTRNEMIDDVFAALAAGRSAPSTLHDMVATLKICDAYNADQRN